METGKHDPLESAISNAFVNVLQEKSNTSETKSKDETNTSKKVLTVLNLNAIPKDIIDKDYFEREFFPLKTKKDYQKLNSILQGAKKSLEGGRYYFEERPNKFPEKINRIFEKGFNSIQDFLDLVSFTHPKTKENNLKIIDHEPTGINSNTGDREAACRILQRSVANYSLEPHIEILQKAVGSLFGENGMFRHIETDILEKEEKRREKDPNNFSNLPFVEDKKNKGFFLFGNELFGLDGESAFLFSDKRIKEVWLNFKDTGKGVDKIERKRKVTGQDINDLYRMRILSDSEANNNVEFLLEIMWEIEKMAYASAKHMAEDLGFKNLKVEVESREINYLSDDQKKKYFPDKNEREKDSYSGILRNMILKENKGLKKSSDVFKNMSQKISYIDPETNKYIFSFEIQYLTQSENKKNENEKQAGGHFMMELRNFSNLIFNGGKRERKGVLKSIRRYILWYQNKFIDTKEIENFPATLHGEFQETPGWISEKHGKFRKGGYKSGTEKIYFDNFRKAPLNQKTEMIFQFLWAEGKIKKVPIDFPKDIFAKRTSHKKTLAASPYFCSSDHIKMLKEITTGLFGNEKIKKILEEPKQTALKM